MVTYIVNYHEKNTEKRDKGQNYVLHPQNGDDPVTSTLGQWLLSAYYALLLQIIIN